MEAASTRPNSSGCSVSSLAITSSLIHAVPNNSRAISAVATASLAVWQPAVLGSTRTPSCSINSQKPWPARARADFAAERNGDDLGGRRLDGVLERRGRGILRRSEQQARGEALSVDVEHHPPCLGATISTSSLGESRVSPRLAEATKLPLTAVATLACAKPSVAHSSASVRASVATVSPLTRICNEHLRIGRAGLDVTRPRARPILARTRSRGGKGRSHKYSAGRP